MSMGLHLGSFVLHTLIKISRLECNIPSMSVDSAVSLIFRHTRTYPCESSYLKKDMLRGLVQMVRI